ncbi:hypothetical protein [Paenibacillus sp. SN-8-1]|uniref:hypothetical protein n=1 Tax=Paenibacillus sp. SN-8-1 TaxID=3435409 RepID=UPI003D9A22D1
MKKLAAITATLALSAAFATAASADTAPVTTTNSTGTSTTTSTPVVTSTTVSSPIIVPDLIVANPPKKWEILKVTTFYKDPNGKAWGKLDPQVLEPTGQIIGDWVEIYTWLGKGWVFAPEYTK